MILITAANGNQGKLLVPKLLTASLRIRACVPSESCAAALRKSGVISARYSSHDFISNPNVLTWLLGREPTTFKRLEKRAHAAFNAQLARAKENAQPANHQ